MMTNPEKIASLITEDPDIFVESYEGLEDSDEFGGDIDVTNRIVAEYFASLDPDSYAEIAIVHSDSDAWQYKGMFMRDLVGDGGEVVVDIS